MKTAFSTYTKEEIGKNLTAEELKIGDIVYFCKSAKGQKKRRFRKCKIKQICRKQIVVEVFPAMPRATKTYDMCIGFSDIFCGEVVIRRHILASESASCEDIAAQ